MPRLARSRTPLARAALAAVVTCGLAAPALADGDVQVTLERRGLVRIVGDAAANAIEVETGPGRSGYRVVGLDGTTVNGLSSFDVASARRISIDTGDGDDVVVLDAVRIPRGLTVWLGAGDDALHMPGVRAFGRTRISGGTGANEITTDFHAVFHGPLRIRTFEGDDSVRLERTTFHAPFRVLTGDGDDDVSLARVTVHESARLSVRTGNGDDRVRIEESAIDASVRVATLAGEDDLEVRSTDFGERVLLAAGGDEDACTLTDCGFRRKLLVVGGRGGDRLTTSGLTFHFTLVVRGSGSSRSTKFFWSFVIVHVF